MAADYQLPYKPNDPEYIAWDSGLDQAGVKLSCTCAANLIDAALEGRG